MTHIIPKPDTPPRAGGHARGRRSGPRKPKPPKALDDFEPAASATDRASAETAPNPDAPPLYLSDLKALHVSELLEMAESEAVEGAHRLHKQELVFALLRSRARDGRPIYGDGTLEVLPEGYGFLRSPDTSYLAGTDDIYVAPSLLRRLNLRTGDTVEGELRAPKSGERYFALVRIDRINGRPPVNGGRNPREPGDEVTAAERTPHRCPADDSGVQGVEGTAAEGALEGARRATGDAPSAARRRGAVARPAAEMTSGIEMR